MSRDLEVASDSPANEHGSSSEKNTGAGPATSSAAASFACHLSQLCVANSQAMLPRWPLCIQVTMVLQLLNSLLLKATVQSKSKQFF